VASVIFPKIRRLFQQKVQKKFPKKEKYIVLKGKSKGSAHHRACYLKEVKNKISCYPFLTTIPFNKIWGNKQLRLVPRIAHI
jgi:hypothetical protein